MTFYMSEKLFGYTGVKQINFAPLAELKQAYHYARLAGAMRHFYNTSGFENADNLLKSDLYGNDEAGWTKYGRSLLPGLRDGTVQIPIRATNLAGEEVEGWINRLMYVFIDKPEFETLLATAPAYVIYQPYFTHNPWEGPADIGAGAMTLLLGNRLIVISYNRGVNPDWTNQMLVSPDLTVKLQSLLRLSNASANAMIQTLILPKIGTVSKKDFAIVYYIINRTYCHSSNHQQCLDTASKVFLK